MKRLIVKALEDSCSVNDRLINLLPGPISIMMSRTPGLRRLGSCPLALLSARLDQRWKTGVWQDHAPTADV